MEVARLTDDELGGKGGTQGLTGLIFFEGLTFWITQEGHFQLQIRGDHLTLANIGAGD